MKTVEDIVAEWLTEHGYDGLYDGDADCACLLGDVAPCGGPFGDCKAGYKVPCDCGEHNYHVQEEKPGECHGET